MMMMRRSQSALNMNILVHVMRKYFAQARPKGGLSRSIVRSLIISYRTRRKSKDDALQENRRNLQS